MNKHNKDFLNMNNVIPHQSYIDDLLADTKIEEAASQGFVVVQYQVSRNQVTLRTVLHQHMLHESRPAASPIPASWLENI